MVSGRILRWSLTLSAYDYQFKYKPGNQIAHADALSRLPLPDAPTTVPTPAETAHLLNFLSSAPITAKLIADQSTRDPVLSQVLRHLEMGWPDTVEDALSPYLSRKNELTLGCKSRGPNELEARSFTNAPRGARWHCENCVLCQKICLLARY